MPRGRRARVVSHDDDTPTPPRRRATTPDIREQQLIAKAYDLTERRISEGTASAQEVTLFLKLGSSRERLEQEKIQHENQLLQVKREAIAQQARTEELFAEAIRAMRSYQGQSVDDLDDPPRSFEVYDD
jgi:hypothetical protein